MDVVVRDDAWLAGDVEGEGSRCVGPEGCYRHCKRGVSDGFSGRT